MAFDEPLRDAVGAAAAFTLVAPPNCPILPELHNQPSVPALAAIDNLFRAKGLFLGTYAQCEINRWMVSGGDAFRQALADLGAALPRTAPGGQPPTGALAEAVGVLAADPELRARFGNNSEHLRSNGFEISAPEEIALRTDFAPGSPASAKAQLVFDLGWTTSSCLGRMRRWEGMFHVNI